MTPRSIELLHVEDIPARVTIHEAVELAKIYGGGQSYRFVNGLLDGIARKRGWLVEDCHKAKGVGLAVPIAATHGRSQSCALADSCTPR